MSSPPAPHPVASLVRDPDAQVVSLYGAGQYDDALARVETLLGATAVEPAVAGRLRAWRALMLRVMGQSDAGLAEARSLAEDARLAQDLPLHFEALRVQAACLDARGEHAEALRLCERAVAGLSRAGDLMGEAHARRLASTILVRLGNSELALREGVRTSDLYRSLEGWDHLTGMLLQLADCLQDLGRGPEAEALLEEALVHQ